MNDDAHDATNDSGSVATAAPWFFAPLIPGAGETIELDPSESHHAANARRRDVTQPIAIFNGTGVVALCTIMQIDKRGRSLIARVESVESRAPATPRLTIATALPKGDRQSMMFNMLAQLGVARVIPLITEHGVAKPGSSFETRTRRILIEACKQSRNPFVPMLCDAMTLPDVLNEHADLTILAQPGHQPLGAVMEASDATDVLVCIGPEGGFSPSELTLGAPNLECASLNANILRIETAAVAAASIVMATRLAELPR